MSDDVLFVDEYTYYDICKRFPAASNEDVEIQLCLGSKIRRTPFTNN